MFPNANVDEMNVRIAQGSSVSDLIDWLTSKAGSAAASAATSQSATRTRDMYTHKNNLDIRTFMRDNGFLLDVDADKLFPVPNNDDNYTEHCRVALLNEFPAVKEQTISTVMEMNRNSYHNSRHMLYNEINPPPFDRSKPVRKRLAVFQNMFCMNPREYALPWPKNIHENFFREYQFVLNEEEIKRYCEQNRLEEANKTRDCRARNELMECAICTNDECLPHHMHACNAKIAHLFCRNCVRNHAIQIASHGGHKVTCLDPNCQGEFLLGVVSELLPVKIAKLLTKNVQQVQLRMANVENIKECPFCDFKMIIENAQEKNFHCHHENCGIVSCLDCKEPEHLPLKCSEVERDEETKLRTHIENEMANAMMRTCPTCSKKIIKESGCNRMRCVCGANICYICNELLPPEDPYSHFKDTSCKQNSTDVDLHQLRAYQAGKKAKDQFLKDNPQAQIRNKDVNLVDMVDNLPAGTTRALQKQGNDRLKKQRDGVQRLNSYVATRIATMARKLEEAKTMVGQDADTLSIAALNAFDRRRINIQNLFREAVEGWAQHGDYAATFPRLNRIKEPINTFLKLLRNFEKEKRSCGPNQNAEDTAGPSQSARSAADTQTDLSAHASPLTRKLARYLHMWIQLSRDREVAIELVQGLVDGQMSPQMFMTGLQFEMEAKDPPPQLLPLMEEAVPQLRRDMAAGHVTINGITKPDTVAPTNVPDLDVQKMKQVVKKAAGFFTTLLTLARQRDVRDDVVNLVQAVIDGTAPPELFVRQLRDALQSAPQPNLLPFLEVALPELQREMAAGNLIINGITKPQLGDHHRVVDETPNVTPPIAQDDEEDEAIPQPSTSKEANYRPLKRKSTDIEDEPCSSKRLVPEKEYDKADVVQAVKKARTAYQVLQAETTACQKLLVQATVLENRQDIYKKFKALMKQRDDALKKFHEYQENALRSGVEEELVQIASPQGFSTEEIRASVEEAKQLKEQSDKQMKESLDHLQTDNNEPTGAADTDEIRRMNVILQRRAEIAHGRAVLSASNPQVPYTGHIPHSIYQPASWYGHAPLALQAHPGVIRYPLDQHYAPIMLPPYSYPLTAQVIAPPAPHVPEQNADIERPNSPTPGPSHQQPQQQGMQMDEAIEAVAPVDDEYDVAGPSHAHPPPPRPQKNGDEVLPAVGQSHVELLPAEEVNVEQLHREVRQAWNERDDVRGQLRNIRRQRHLLKQDEIRLHKRLYDLNKVYKDKSRKLRKVEPPASPNSSNDNTNDGVDDACIVVDSSDEDDNDDVVIMLHDTDPYDQPTTSTADHHIEADEDGPARRQKRRISDKAKAFEMRRYEAQLKSDHNDDDSPTTNRNSDENIAQNDS